MKKEYEAPELEITVFEPEDIIASLINGGGGGSGDFIDWDDIT